MALNMNARYPGWGGSYREQTYPVSYGFNSQGTATFGLYGPLFFNDSELEFLKTLNVWVLVIGFLALSLSLLLGALMARWISHPILRVTQTAHQFRLGNWNPSLLVKSGIAEIVDLSRSIEALGENLQNQEQLRKRLTADISHELRSPLSVLQGRLEALIDGVWEIDGAQLEFIRQEVLRLTRLVGQLENLTQIESHQTPNRSDRLSVRPFLTSLLDPFLAEAQVRHLSLTAEATVLEFVADEDKTRQILFNLVSNAMKYTESGWIKVSSREEIDRICFEVEDNGMGIAARDLPFIFERFYRADVSRTRATGGAGLGLAIAKSLAESQGGTLSVESREGKGSRFSLTLPKNPVGEEKGI
jgi:signal transduction histidine kinase